MTTFDRREEAFESMFAHDEEMHFRAVAHRNKLLGAWVAVARGLSREEAEQSATDLVAYAVTNGGDEALFQRVRAELPDTVSDGQIRERMSTLMAESVAFVKTA